MEARARALGVQDHRTVDGKQAVYDRFVSYLIKGNCLRGGVYPMCVGAERVVQAEEVVRVAEEIGAKGVAHGSTGAGNDQVRFDVAIRALAPRLEIHAPVRELNWSREQETAWLAERGVHTPPKTTAYSINVGLFGTTIGGKETHDTWAMPPEEVYGMTVPPEKARDQAEELVLSFEHGLPVALDGRAMDGVELLAALERAREAPRRRPRHPRRRHDPRPQGPPRLRGPGPADPHQGAPRPREARPDQVAVVLARHARRLLRRHAPRGPLLRPGHARPRGLPRLASTRA